MRILAITSYASLKLKVFFINFFFFSLINFPNLHASPLPAPPSFILEEATITSLQEALKNNTLTCENLIKAYLERIRRYNFTTHEGIPPINAFTELNPSALEAARELDKFYAETHHLKGPLHCVPVVLKDNIDSFDTTTTAGSLALLGNQPLQDAFLVKRLRQAGAIILGKGGMDEFAWGMTGISSRSGRIGNAYDSSKNPGGSSGGTAAAISANFAVIGIGTDNSGSIRIPAAFNGLVGLRPSTGLISQSGIFPMGNLDGTAGPMTRSVEDLAVVLSLIAKPDPLDTQTQNVPRINSYKIYLNKEGLRGKRIGIVRHVGSLNTFENMPKEIQSVFQKSFQKLQELGAIVIDDISLDQFDVRREDNQAGEIQDIDIYLGSFPASRKSFYEICQSGQLGIFKTVEECLKFIKTVPPKESSQYKKVRARFKKNKEYIHTVMDIYHLDALAMPITTEGDATYTIAHINTWQAPISSNAGLPSLVFTIGYNPSTHLPIGLEIIGRKFHEGTLIEIAYAYEKETPPRVKPRLISSSYETLYNPKR